jgi:hypothetical protein
MDTSWAENHKVFPAKINNLIQMWCLMWFLNKLEIKVNLKTNLVEKYVGMYGI